MKERKLIIVAKWLCQRECDRNSYGLESSLIVSLSIMCQLTKKERKCERTILTLGYVLWLGAYRICNMWGWLLLRRFGDNATEKKKRGCAHLRDLGASSSSRRFPLNHCIGTRTLFTWLDWHGENNLLRMGDRSANWVLWTTTRMQLYTCCVNKIVSFRSSVLLNSTEFLTPMWVSKNLFTEDQNKILRKSHENQCTSHCCHQYISGRLLLRWGILLRIHQFVNGFECLAITWDMAYDAVMAFVEDVVVSELEQSSWQKSFNPWKSCFFWFIYFVLHPLECLIL